MSVRPIVLVVPDGFNTNPLFVALQKAAADQGLVAKGEFKAGVDTVRFDAPVTRKAPAQAEATS